MDSVPTCDPPSDKMPHLLELPLRNMTQCQHVKKSPEKMLDPMKKRAGNRPYDEAASAAATGKRVEGREERRKRVRGER